MRPEFVLERAKGVEPSSLAWEAKVMPLYDARYDGCEILSGFPVGGKSRRIRVVGQFEVLQLQIRFGKQKPAEAGFQS